LVSYAKQFSQNIGHDFTNRTILLTAITGAAATEIGGRTSASVFKYMRRTDHASFKDIKFFQDTRLSVIDEISFAAYHSVLVKISDNLKEFTECQKYIYGKHAICFLGDFCQLEAIGGDCIYKNRNGIYWEQALNCMVELKGTHRFNDCNDMKTIMPNMRNGVLSKEDRKTLNSRVIGEN
jgi:cAMP phosphodiesterase